MADLNNMANLGMGANAAASPVPQPAADDQFADIKAEMAQRYALLPEDIKQTIVSTNYQQKLFDIAKAHKLTFEELNTLELETTMVLLGMTPPGEYRDEIQIELKKNDDAEVDAIVKDVNDQVFAPVRQALQRVYSSDSSVDATIPPTPVAASSAPAMAFSPAPAPAPAFSAMPPAPSIPVVRIPDVAPAASGSTLSSAEKSVLEKTGVVISDTSMPRATVSSDIPMMPGQAPSMRKELIRDIENPSSIPTAPADKLSIPLSGMAPKVTDYSIPKTPASPAPAQSSKPADLYREPIN